MSRHRSRYRAVQILYQTDLRELGPEQAILGWYETLYSEENEEKPERDSFMEELVRSTYDRRAAIDELLEKHSANWKVDRMPVVDRNLLRVAVYELMQGQTPPAIVIDEALEVARRLCGDESVAFINGVLDAVKRGLAEPPPAE